MVPELKRNTKTWGRQKAVPVLQQKMGINARLGPSDCPGAYFWKHRFHFFYDSSQQGPSRPHPEKGSFKATFGICTRSLCSSCWVAMMLSVVTTANDVRVDTARPVITYSTSRRCGGANTTFRHSRENVHQVPPTERVDQWKSIVQELQGLASSQK